MEMIAEIPSTLPDPHSAQAIGWVCIILVCIIVGMNAVLDFWRKLTKPGGPEKRDVTISTGAASVSDLKEHVSWDAEEHGKLFSKIGGVERGASKALTDEMKALREERREDANQLQDKLDVFQRSVGGLEKATEMQNQSLTAIQLQLNRVIENQKNR